MTDSDDAGPQPEGPRWEKVVIRAGKLAGSFIAVTAAIGVCWTITTFVGQKVFPLVLPYVLGATPIVFGLPVFLSQGFSTKGYDKTVRFPLVAAYGMMLIGICSTWALVRIAGSSFAFGIHLPTFLTCLVVSFLLVVFSTAIWAGRIHDYSVCRIIYLEAVVQRLLDKLPDEERDQLLQGTFHDFCEEGLKGRPRPQWAGRWVDLSDGTRLTMPLRPKYASSNKSARPTLQFSDEA